MPAPVVVPAPACCPAPVATCCPAPAKHHGFFGGMKHKSKGCCETAVSYAPAPCAVGGPAPAPVAVPPAAMPMPMDKKVIDKKPGTSD
jgi:hypothetical protein